MTYVDIPPARKFEIIQEMTQSDNNLLNITLLCKIACVSRLGYYGWIDSADTRKARDEQGVADFQLILIAYQYRSYAKGAHSICMRLLHQNPPVVMNVKKIRRFMAKFGLSCPIRKANPYRRMAKALRTNNVAKNLVNREFEKHGPRTILFRVLSTRG
jgi:hypothetical protein